MQLLILAILIGLFFKIPKFILLMEYSIFEIFSVKITPFYTMILLSMGLSSISQEEKEKEKYSLNQILNLIFLNLFIIGFFSYFSGKILKKYFSSIIGDAFILMAFGPPSTSLISYIKISQGNVERSFITTLILNIISLITFPLIFFQILKSPSINFNWTKIYFLMFLNTFFPLFFKIITKKIFKNEKLNKNIVNFLLFVTTISYVMKSREKIFLIVLKQKKILGMMFFLFFIRYFLNPIIIIRIFKFLNTKNKDYLYEIALFSTLKSDTLGIVLIQNLYGESTAKIMLIPFILAQLFQIFFFILISQIFKKNR